MKLDEIRRRVDKAALQAGRDPSGVELIAVSKVQPADRVTAVLDAGHRVFGENYVQETQAKWPSWRARYDGVRVHMIGPLQSNKARLATELYDAIHTLDRMSLAKKLAACDHRPKLFVQVNTGDEPQKAGVACADLPQFLTAMSGLGLTVEGLMCIPPAGHDPAPHFAILRKLRDEAGLASLSMGMSGDFEVAIAHGATHVRVGSAIFGARDYANQKSE